jgi:hypothetical protein
VDGRRLGAPNDVQRHRLMRIAAEAFDFEIEIASVQRVTQRRRRLGRSLKAEHALVPSLTGEAVSLLARLRSALRRRCRRCFPAIWFPSRENAPDWLASASRYCLWIDVGSAAKPPLVHMIKLTQEREIHRGRIPGTHPDNDDRR